MAYFSTYQQAPGWGTSQYQFLPPPVPTWQPQPSWRGLDFYRAASGMNADPYLYNYAWDSLGNYGGSGGLGLVEAKMLHRRAYGGLGDIAIMAPNEIGAAAAYEVFRTWRYHYGIVAQPLSGDREQQREALISLAIGEASRLYECTGRIADNTGRLAAVAAAAITASLIFEQAQQLAMGAGMGAGAMGGMGVGEMGGMGMGGLSPSGILTPLPGSPLAGGMGMGMNGGMLGAPPLVRQRSLSTGALMPGLMPGMGMGGLGGAGMGAGMGMGMGMGAGMMGGAGGLGAGGLDAGGLGAGGVMGGMGGYGGEGGLLGAGGYVPGLRRSRSFTALGGGLGAGGLVGGQYGGGMAGGYGGGMAGGYGGGGMGSMGGMGGMIGGGYGAGSGLYGAAQGSYAAPAAAYAQGNIGAGGLLGEEALARHERHKARRRRRSYSGERRHRHRHGRRYDYDGYGGGYGGGGLAETLGGYEAGRYGGYGRYGAY